MLSAVSRFELKFYCIGAERGDSATGLNEWRRRTELVCGPKGLRTENEIKLLE
jgi:hypothetical protein